MDSNIINELNTWRICVVYFSSLIAAILNQYVIMLFFVQYLKVGKTLANTIVWATFISNNLSLISDEICVLILLKVKDESVKIEKYGYKIAKYKNLIF